jgi:hypothetical protein
MPEYVQYVPLVRKEFNKREMKHIELSAYLLLDGFIPPRFHEDTFVRHGQVKTDAAGFQRGDHDLDTRVVFEIPDALVTGREGHVPKKLKNKAYSQHKSNSLA